MCSHEGTYPEHVAWGFLGQGVIAHLSGAASGDGPPASCTTISGRLQEVMHSRALCALAASQPMAATAAQGAADGSQSGLRTQVSGPASQVSDPRSLDQPDAPGGTSDAGRQTPGGTSVPSPKSLSFKL